MDKLGEAIAVLFDKNPILVLIILFMMLVITVIGGIVLLIITGKIRIPEYRLKKKNKNPHYDCPYNFDRIIEAQKAFERGQAIMTLHNQRVKQSMEECEIVIDKVHRDMTDLFYKIVAEIMGMEDGAMKHPESIHYKALTGSILNRDCKDYFRHCVRENHFHEKTEIEFDYYVNEQINQLIGILTGEMDLYYTPIIISNEALFKRNQEIISTIKADITKLFYRVRSITVDTLDQAVDIMDAQGMNDPEQRKKELKRI